MCDAGVTGGYWRSFCDGTRWQITICARTPAINWQWTHHPSSANDRNIASSLIHEFGHTIGLGHTQDGEYSVMNSSGIPNHGTLRGRWLYPGDIQCHHEEWGTRSNRFLYRSQDHGNDNINPAITLGNSYVRGPGNIITDTPNYLYSTVGYDGTRFQNSFGSTLGSPNRYFHRPYIGIAFTNFWTRELPTEWRTYYNYDNTSSNRYTNPESKTNIRQYAYDLLFSAPPNQGIMRHCFYDPPNCSPKTMFSSHPISISHYQHYDRTVYAWVNQTRGYSYNSGINEADREIWISIGQRGTDPFLLNKPFKTGIRSSTNVSLTCGVLFSAGGWDCIIAYTPLENSSYGMRVKRFFIHEMSEDHYSINWDPITHTVGWLNGSDITTWFNNDKYWLAHKTGKYVRVRSSDTGETWEHYGSLGESITAPRAISHSANNNKTTWIYLTRD